jgi:hypothetical protein
VILEIRLKAAVLEVFSSVFIACLGLTHQETEGAEGLPLDQAGVSTELANRDARAGLTLAIYARPAPAILTEAPPTPESDPGVIYPLAAIEREIATLQFAGGTV